MPKVIFKFDKEKDLHNIWETANFESNWGDFKKNLNPEILEMCENKKFEDIKDELEKYYEKVHNSSMIKITIDSFNESWNKINNEFFKRLEKIMKKPMCCEEITGYLTTAGRCPYNPDKNNPFFMTNFFTSIPHALKVSAHEIMHIQFHNIYWKEVEDQIGREKTADLKEALTVLLNLEFKDLWFVNDLGYPSHQELREFISEKWKENPDFDILLDECIKYLK
tara:strand:+ start:7859 stop:8527 length:669 start_codon:yes stop_codon:yes gene_type:complete